MTAQELISKKPTLRSDLWAAMAGKMLLQQAEQIEALVDALGSFTKSDYIIKQHPVRYKNAVAALVATKEQVPLFKVLIDKHPGLADELARCKIAANEAADRIQANLETKGLHGYSFLFADIATLCLKPAEDFQNTVTARITTHEAQEAARLESEREKIRAEEQAKAQREAAAEAILAEAARVAAEQMASTTALAATDQLITGTCVTKTTVSGDQIVTQHVPVANVIPMTRTANTPPTLKLGAINERIAPIQITADGLRALGFEPDGRAGAAMLFYEHNYPLMLAALVRHVERIQRQQAA